MRRIVALAGGVGGSRFARGLHAAVPDAHLSVVVNTGDDVSQITRAGQFAEAMGIEAVETDVKALEPRIEQGCRELAQL